MANLGGSSLGFFVRGVFGLGLGFGSESISTK